MLSRRELLALPLAVGAAALLGSCTGDEPPVVDPQLAADVASLERALEVERRLLAAATDASEASAVAVLGAHVDLLAAAVPGSSAATTSTPSGAAAGLDRRGLRAAAGGHLADLAAVTGPVARLLASVAASDLALAQTLPLPSDRQA